MNDLQIALTHYNKKHEKEFEDYGNCHIEIYENCSMIRHEYIYLDKIFRKEFSMINGVNGLLNYLLNN